MFLAYKQKFLATNIILFAHLLFIQTGVCPAVLEMSQYMTQVPAVLLVKPMQLISLAQKAEHSIRLLESTSLSTEDEAVLTKYLAYSFFDACML